MWASTMLPSRRISRTLSRLCWPCSTWGMSASTAGITPWKTCHTARSVPAVPPCAWKCLGARRALGAQAHAGAQHPAQAPTARRRLHASLAVAEAPQAVEPSAPGGALAHTSAAPRSTSSRASRRRTASALPSRTAAPLWATAASSPAGVQQLARGHVVGGRPHVRLGFQCSSACQLPLHLWPANVPPAADRCRRAHVAARLRQQEWHTRHAAQNEAQVACALCACHGGGAGHQVPAQALEDPMGQLPDGVALL